MSICITFPCMVMYKYSLMLYVASAVSRFYFLFLAVLGKKTQKYCHACVRILYFFLKKATAFTELLIIWRCQRAQSAEFFRKMQKIAVLHPRNSLDVRRKTDRYTNEEANKHRALNHVSRNQEGRATASRGVHCWYKECGSGASSLAISTRARQCRTRRSSSFLMRPLFCSPGRTSTVLCTTSSKILTATEACATNCAVPAVLHDMGLLSSNGRGGLFLPPKGDTTTSLKYREVSPWLVTSVVYGNPRLPSCWTGLATS